MEVCVNGSMLSALFYDNLNSPGDQEGFLLGHTVSKVTDSISDSHINTVKEETVTYLQTFIPCSRIYSFYNHLGEIVDDKLSNIICGKDKEVLGWYRFRRNSTLNISQRESAIHRHLMSLFPGKSSNHFVFLLLVQSHTSGHSTHSFDHVCLGYNKSEFCPLPLVVRNLGKSTLTEYKDYRVSQCIPGSSTYTNVLQHFQRDFMESSGKLREVVYIKQVNSIMHQKLKTICDNIVESEHDVGKLQDEVKELRQKLKRKKSINSKKKAASLVDLRSTDSIAMSTANSIPLEMDRQLLQPINVKKKQSRSVTKTAPPHSPKDSELFSFVHDYIQEEKHKSITLAKSSTLPRNSKLRTSSIETSKNLLEVSYPPRQSSEPPQIEHDSTDTDENFMQCSPVF